ncbi:MAG: hypothetical protein JWO95_3483, partial [Verrucomicrobiales bacterium]|nr:hypothetical protein [Verrucomicrobiales bacterium]
MKIHFALVAIITLAAAASAQETVATLDWKAIQQSGQGATSGTVVTTNGQTFLKIASNDAGLETRLLTITNPPISKHLYAITGQIKYEGVSGDGYLEMWSYFPPLNAGMPEGKFFSRTMAQYGEMKKINGTSDWRDFILPFNSEGASGAPTRLEVNIVLPGKGNVYVGPLKLVLYEPNQLGALVRGGWTNGMGPGIGIIGMALVGCIGLFLGWLAKNGRARTFVIFGLRALAVLGVLLIIAGLLALLRKQPSALWLPMLLFGTLLTAIFFQLPTIQR